MSALYRFQALLAMLVVLIWAPSMLLAQQDFTALARLDPAASTVSRDGRDLHVDLYLSQPVPWRVFTLDSPRRLVIDFREIDWRGAERDRLLQTDLAGDLRFGTLRPGWSRMVIDLSAPLALREAGMTVSAADGTARLQLRLAPVDPSVFRAEAGAPPDPGWDALTAADPTLAPPAAPDDGLMIVAIDPGHGGLDPGAERGTVREADLVLQLAREVAAAINATAGMRAVLTRSSDVFVPLEERMTIARNAGADILISIHADALEEDEARGASVYTLSDAAMDQASERMAERHDRGDLLAGLDLRGTDDRVATALMDLARLQTRPQSLRFADTLVAALDENGARLNNQPRREAVLAVLNAADFPSVLLEAGFLSNAEDLAHLTTPEGRAPIVNSLVAALARWAALEEAIPGLGGN